MSTIRRLDVLPELRLHIARQMPDEAASWVVPLAFAHSYIVIADGCGEGAFLSRHGQQRPHPITS